MTISLPQKSEIEAIIEAILDMTTSRRRRQLAEMFLDLVDRESWPEYYQVAHFSSLRVSDPFLKETHKC